MNVGVNTKHGSLRSPRFVDGSFEFVTIPDEEVDECPRAVRYGEFPTVTGIRPERFVPEKFLNHRSHYDPEFATPTYGDVPRKKPRALNLLKVAQGDTLVFYARLVDWDNGRFLRSQAGMYFVGYIIVSTIHRDLVIRPDRNVLRRISKNAHIIRAECLGDYDLFHVFEGSGESRRLEHALPFSKSMVRRYRIKDANGRQIAWNNYSSEVSAIGSYFRSVRVIEDERQADAILGYVYSGE